MTQNEDDIEFVDCRLLFAWVIRAKQLNIILIMKILNSGLKANNPQKSWNRKQDEKKKKMPTIDDNDKQYKSTMAIN